VGRVGERTRSQGRKQVRFLSRLQKLTIMGTNYYRIPTASEMEQRKNRLQAQIRKMDISARAVNQSFSVENPNSWDRFSPWDEFTQDTLVHLGKRSGGWKFCWNFNKEKYYKDKASLEEYVKSGRVIDEYGDELSPEDFLKMAYEWGAEDGWDTQTYYQENPSHRISWMDSSKYHDTYVDGLRVSSSTDFC